MSEGEFVFVAMNLPTVIVDQDSTGRRRVKSSEITYECGYGLRPFDHFPNGTYALIPVESMEQVWWCAKNKVFRRQRECGKKLAHMACGPRWLVTPKEER